MSNTHVHEHSSTEKENKRIFVDRAKIGKSGVPSTQIGISHWRSSFAALNNNNLQNTEAQTNQSKKKTN